ncbi:MAG TPA: hypothetical protein VLT86_15850 [Vicinamibacterales bacterium]|nr:hypothetical protein [Vicinamibacterales bacterium]
MRAMRSWGRMMSVAGALTLAIACGSSGGTGATVLPAVPSGTVVSIQVNSQGPTVFLGAAETFTAIATYSSGGTQTITNGTWSTDMLTVAVAEASTGKVTGVGNGDVTVSVDFQGVRGSKTIRVLPNYTGTWLGSYTVASCTPTDGFADQTFCAQLTSAQPGPGFFFQFAQTADTLTGYTGLGQVPIGSTPFTSSIAADGSVSFTTQLFVATLEIDMTWSLTSVVPGIINGHVTETWQDSTITGQMVVEGTIIPPSRVAAASAARAGAPARFHSIADVIAAAVRR